MRHLGSLVLSLLFAPAIYLLLGYGIVKGDNSDYGKLAITIAAVVVAGVLYGVLILARLSPLGTALAGVALADVSIWSMLPNTTFFEDMPKSLFGTGGVAAAGAGPITLALSVPLILTIFSGTRWRGSESASTLTGSTSSEPLFSSSGSGYSSTSSFGNSSFGGFGSSAFGSPASTSSGLGDSTTTTSPTSPAFGASPSFPSVLGSSYPSTPPSAYPGASGDEPGTTQRL